MNGFRTLYRKELNYLVKPFLVIIVAHLASFIYLMMQDLPAVSSFRNTKPFPDYYFLFYLFFLGSMALFPIMLAYSWFEEWNNKTSLQLLSLPTPRKTVAWSKLAAALTYCLFYTGNMLSYLTFYEKNIIHESVFPDLANTAIITYSIVIWLSGIVTVTAMVLTAAHKHKYILALGSVVACLFVTYQTMIAVSLTTLQIRGIIYMFARNEIIGIATILIIACIFIMFAGHTIFERYQEA